MAENDWRAALPEDLRAAPALKDVTDVAGLAKNYVETKALVGSSIRPPGPDATPEARKEFIEKLTKTAPELVYMPSDEKVRGEVEEGIWRQLGKPADANEYKLEGLELEQGVKLDEKQLREAAKAFGFTKKQFQTFVKAAATEQVQAQKVMKEADGALRTEWGNAYEERVLQAKSAAMKLGVPEAELARMPPALLKVFANAAKAIGGEGRQVGDQGQGGSGRLPPTEAQLRMAELRKDPEYWNGNPAKRARMAELAKDAFPE